LASTFLAVSAVQAQTTWYVNDDAPNDPGPGDPLVSDPNEDGSPDHPFDAIQEGIDAAMDGDTVEIADGTYTGAGNKNLDFAGKAITVRSENGPDNCIIDCEGDGRGFYFHGAEGPDSIVQGLTITNGSASSGGGVYCAYDNSPTITNCTISGNSADNCGGGVHCANSSSPRLANCTINSNSADGGGGVYCFWYSSPTFTNCRISGNSADGGGGVQCVLYSVSVERTAPRLSAVGRVVRVARGMTVRAG
jgi:parallel beta-helix repeat protein